MSAILTLYDQQGNPIEIPAFQGPAGTLENHTVYRSRAYTIPLAAWQGSGPYTYEVTDDTITPQTIFLPSDEAALMGQLADGSTLSWPRDYGKITFMVTSLPPGTLTINGMLVESSAAPFDMQTLLDLVYPIGSYYITDKDGETDRPAARFGGTWERVTDKFLLGAGGSYAAGSEGGAATISVERKNLPDDAVVLAYSDKINDSINPSRFNLGVWGDNGIGSTQSYIGLPLSQSTIEKNVALDTMPPYTSVYIWRRVDPQEVA